MNKNFGDLEDEKSSMKINPQKLSVPKMQVITHVILISSSLVSYKLVYSFVIYGKKGEKEFVRMSSCICPGGVKQLHVSRGVK